MGAVAQALAQPSTFTHDGKDYSVSPWVLEIQALFERYLEKEAVLACERNARYMAPDAYARALKDVLQEIGAHEYTWGTDKVGRSLDVPTNVVYIFWLCVKKNHRELTLDWAKELGRVPETYRAMIQAMNRANDAPNPQSPEEKTNLTSPAEA